MGVGEQEVRERERERDRHGCIQWCTETDSNTYPLVAKHVGYNLFPMHAHHARTLTYI